MDSTPGDSSTLTSTRQSVQHSPIASRHQGELKAVPLRQHQRHRISVRSVQNSIRSDHRRAKHARLRRLLESDEGEVYGDEVLARIFRCQRDKRIKRKIDLVELRLRNIQRDIQILRETLTHAQ